MENTTSDLDALLHDLNDEIVVQMIPAIVYMAVLMLTGVAGNLMVCYYYGFKTRLTPNTLFIIGLAVFDLITCTFAIPLEIYGVRMFYTFYNVAACKCMRFVSFFASISSATILLTIAIDRYRRICRISYNQYTLKDAVRAIVIAIVIAIFLSWPVFILWTPEKMLVRNDHHISLYGSTCTTAKTKSLKVYMWVFNGVYLLAFFLYVVILCVLYYLVGKVLLKYSRVRKRYSGPIAADRCPSDSNETETSFAAEVRSNELDEEITEAKSSGTHDSPRPRLPNSELSTGNQTESQQIDRQTVIYATVMLSITVAFIISYLPYLALAIWRVFIDVNSISDTGFILFQIGIRSYMINSAINPFIYGFFNSKFRKFFYRLFCPFCSNGITNNTTT